MDGIHDMGGMHGLGPIEVEPNEPVFHHEWEARMFGISCAATGHPDWSTAQSIAAMCRRPWNGWQSKRD